MGRGKGEIVCIDDCYLLQIWAWFYGVPVRPLGENKGHKLPADLRTATDGASQGGPDSSGNTFQESASSMITLESPGVEDVGNPAARRNVTISNVDIPIMGSSLTAAIYKHDPIPSLPASSPPRQNFSGGDVGPRTKRGDSDDS
ncbi:uncharacterized protein LAESUDRAFT_751277 [Laetiporus sulphureus 93-53]|uniref:Uncharacterized protein n=1 Tax=Laetiporus sulphureus 93-53 TaxID=1314785 RepID=A0A165D5Z9_9APHY|nr:uncharacterized protein LAESUDRAFT_751277 [Laetiporus sulphureus 93-53]KZT04213.1 hypothetical protein LAESUDRAFT_751277 [Laetiporus sulphureus 93-53]